MEISRRLQAVAGEVGPCCTMADIGTDHAYVPLYLLSKGLIKRAVACDIKNGPLKKAAQNCNKYGFEREVELRLGDGLKPVRPGEVQEAVIAGMGGMLMTDILRESRITVEKLDKLVLQPQLDIDSVRRYLHSIGFRIQNEIMLREEGKYYNVITAVPGGERYEREIEYTFGKILIDKKDTVLKEYLLNGIEKQKEIREALKGSGSEKSQQRMRELERQEIQYKEALACL